MTRKRWVYSQGKAIEVPEDFEQPKPEAMLRVVNDRHYDGLQATDGADISTRRKHREYMRRNGLTTMDDFTETWKKAAKERQDRMAGIDKNRKQDIASAIHQLTEGNRHARR